MIELTEKEFLKLLDERIKKAADTGNMAMYREHVSLKNYYEKCRESGYILRYYLSDDALVVVPYTKEEYELLEKKYREAGIFLDEIKSMYEQIRREFFGNLGDDER